MVVELYLVAQGNFNPMGPQGLVIGTPMLQIGLLLKVQSPETTAATKVAQAKAAKYPIPECIITAVQPALALLLGRGPVQGMNF